MLFEEQVAYVFSSIFGNPLFIGVFLMFFFFILGVAFRLSGETIFLMLIIAYLTIVAYYIPALIPLTIIGFGILVGVIIWALISR